MNVQMDISPTIMSIAVDIFSQTVNQLSKEKRTLNSKIAATTLNKYNRLLSLHCFHHQSTINLLYSSVSCTSYFHSKLIPFQCQLLFLYLLHVSPSLQWGNYLPMFPPTNYLSFLSLHSGICAFPHSVSSLTLTIVSIPLVSGEAGAVVRPDVICTMGKHVARSGKGRFHFIHYHHWANCNCVRICIVISSPIFALIVIGHTAALSSPPVIAVTLRE